MRKIVKRENNWFLKKLAEKKSKFQLYMKLTVVKRILDPQLQQYAVKQGNKVLLYFCRKAVMGYLI